MEKEHSQNCPSCGAAPGDTNTDCPKCRGVERAERMAKRAPTPDEIDRTLAKIQVTERAYHGLRWANNIVVEISQRDAIHLSNMAKDAIREAALKLSIALQVLGAEDSGVKAIFRLSRAKE